MGDKPMLDDWDWGDDDECPYCGGGGYIEGSCTCEYVEDVCCCADPEPRPCTHCWGNGPKKQASPELQKVLADALRGDLSPITPADDSTEGKET